MRRCLKPNHGTEAASLHVVVDTETTPYPDKHGGGSCTHLLSTGLARRWRMEGGRQTRQAEVVFSDRNVFWNWLFAGLDARRPCWVWAHNAGFDLTALRLWEVIESGELRLQDGGKGPAKGGSGGGKGKPWSGCCVTEDPPTIICCRHSQGATVRFVDSLNWCLAPLSEIASSLGMSKLPMPGEVASEEDWLAYCRRDVEILERMVLEIVDMVRSDDLGTLKSTVASQSMHFFRHRCMTCPIIFDTRPGPKRLERAAYYGPRAICYFQGAVLPPGTDWAPGLAGAPPGMPAIHRGPVWKLDLTGAYPSVMRGHSYPVSFIKGERNVPVNDLEGLLKAFCVIARVGVDCNHGTVPVRRQGEVWWVQGKTETVLAGPELLVALRDGIVKCCPEAQLYASDRPFDRFVDQVWALRQRYQQAGNQFRARLAKSLANALHGKFAQRSHPWELLPGLAAPVPWGTYWEYDAERQVKHLMRSVAWNVQRAGDEAEAADSFPAIAAYCTSYHRLRMNEIRLLAGLRDTLYEHADTVHVTDEGHGRLVASGQLADDVVGRLRVEQRVEKAVYFGPGHYQLGSELTLVGLSRKAKLDSHGVWHQDNFLRLNGLLSREPPVGPISTERQIAQPAPAVRGRIQRTGWVDPLKV